MSIPGPLWGGNRAFHSWRRKRICIIGTEKGGVWMTQDQNQGARPLYRDIAERTQGDLYIGVVGPVRTGKSTFIKHFMEQLVLPLMAPGPRRDRLNDELPQSGSGKTVMTTQPQFIPGEGAAQVHRAGDRRGPGPARVPGEQIRCAGDAAEREGNAAGRYAEAAFLPAAGVSPAGSTVFRARLDGRVGWAALAAPARHRNGAYPGRNHEENAG